MGELETVKFYGVNGRLIRFRNFAGKPGQYNMEGDRNFCLLLAPEDADALQKDGYNVRYLRPRDESEEPQPYIQIKVAYRNRRGESKRPPKIVQITSHGKTTLNEETITNLDWADIEKADIAINPHPYDNVNGRSGIKAYLKTMYVTIAEDDFESRYLDVPDSAQNITDEDAF